MMKLKVTNPNPTGFGLKIINTENNQDICRIGEVTKATFIFDPLNVNKLILEVQGFELLESEITAEVETIKVPELPHNFEMMKRVDIPRNHSQLPPPQGRELALPKGGSIISG